MRTITRFVLVLLAMITPTLQLGAMESERERFKQQLLNELRAEINDMSAAEIRTIIDEVEQSIDAYIEKYEAHPERLRTKDEVYLEQHRADVALTHFSILELQSGKSQEQLFLERLNPRLKMMSDDDYYYNEETKEIEFTMSKDKMFAPKATNFAQKYAWDYLDRGDVLINISNGKSSSLLGHAGLMFKKGSRADRSVTIEALGYGYDSQFVNYSSWHDNKWDKLSYNYVPALFGTVKPANAALYAENYLLDKPYGLFHALGTSNAVYCTELVFLAYLSQGVNLGNGMNIGSWGILMPKAMYCDADLMYYYRQNLGGGVC